MVSFPTLWRLLRMRMLLVGTCASLSTSPVFPADLLADCCPVLWCHDSNKMRRRMNLLSFNRWESNKHLVKSLSDHSHSALEFPGPIGFILFWDMTIRGLGFRGSTISNPHTDATRARGWLRPLPKIQSLSFMNGTENMFS